MPFVVHHVDDASSSSSSFARIGAVMVMIGESALGVDLNGAHEARTPGRVLMLDVHHQLLD